MPTEPCAGGSRDMHRFVSRLQVLAGRLCESSVSELLDDFDQLAGDIPVVTGRVEQLAVASLLHAALQRLLKVLDCEVALPRTHELNHKTFGEALQQIRSIPPACKRARLVDLGEIIDRRSAEQELSVAGIAAELKMSRWQLTRTLIRQTGHGFQWHLHAGRIRRAAELLAESTLSIKEISARVGYSRTNQLDRHFRRIVGMTPSQFRHPTAAAFSPVRDHDNRCRAN